MRIKYNTWTGTYWVYRPGRPVLLTKHATPKMRELMKKSPKMEKQFKVWEDENGGH